MTSPMGRVGGEGVQPETDLEGLALKLEKKRTLRKACLIIVSLIETSASGWPGYHIVLYTCMLLCWFTIGKSKLQP